MEERKMHNEMMWREQCENGAAVRVALARYNRVKNAEKKVAKGIFSAILNALKTII
jgi:hypothetical protein